MFLKYYIKKHRFGFLSTLSDLKNYYIFLDLLKSYAKHPEVEPTGSSLELFKML